MANTKHLYQRLSPPTLTPLGLVEQTPKVLGLAHPEFPPTLPTHRTPYTLAFVPGIHEALTYTNTMVHTPQTTPVESIYNTIEATEKMVAELI